jgi:hypothetical protein
MCAKFFGVPSFVKSCRSVARTGGRASYALVGRELMRHVRGFVPDSISDAEWGRECDELDRLVQAESRLAIFDWFCGHFPRCMALVPKRRAATFLRGVFEMSEI